ncbi:microtubule-associated protein RP/EB family member 2-like [Condylostylus longicornis]|uniref:microtubule-associated protein RP/EB family member 2-like n=1 Tax=Condylostylus longicornis TaxID=2530218 RepID=UPI00244E362F|nr:microtubule-associated protein RP/EB family member 2-like [Condylostylus longicornis]XP_055386709.1 microtubule-associated protein RP/EB family member 2-like [Condylostylus longicornis]
MAINVPLTNYSGEKLSRHELLNWVNDTLSANYKKIEELCSGIAYCQLMEKIFPGSVAMKKLKVNAKMDHEYIWNLKLFQSAFTKLECDKTVPINQLMKGKFQDNFEFLLWFKRFYEVNGGLDVDSSKNKETNNNNIVKTSTRKSLSTNLTTTDKTSQNSSSKSSYKGTPSPHAQSPRSQSPNKDGSQSPSALKILNTERDTLKLHYETVEKEKLFYFDRLRKVEILCDENEDNPDFADIIKKIRNLMYQTEGKGNEEIITTNEEPEVLEEY